MKKIILLLIMFLSSNSFAQYDKCNYWYGDTQNAYYAQRSMYDVIYMNKFDCTKIDGSPLENLEELMNAQNRQLKALNDYKLYVDHINWHIRNCGSVFTSSPNWLIQQLNERIIECKSLISIAQSQMLRKLK